MGNEPLPFQVGPRNKVNTGFWTSYPSPECEHRAAGVKDLGPRVQAVPPSGGKGKGGGVDDASTRAIGSEVTEWHIPKITLA